jgi:Spy/CpxP family protein refolding chaperone
MRHLFFAFFLFLLVESPLQAQPDNERSVWKKMDLTAEQASALKTIRHESQKKMIDLRAELRKARLDFRNLRGSENTDRKRIEQLARQIADLRVEQVLLLHDADEEVKEVLSPEQQQYWREIKNERRDRTLGLLRERGLPGQRDGAMFRRDGHAPPPSR